MTVSVPRLISIGFLVFCCALSSKGIAEKSANPEVVIGSKLFQPPPTEAQRTALLDQRRIRLEEARKCAEKVANLSDDQIAASAAGRLTDEELKKLPDVTAQAAGSSASLPPPSSQSNRDDSFRKNRLLLTGLCAVAFGIMWTVQRRRKAVSK